MDRDKAVLTTLGAGPDLKLFTNAVHQVSLLSPGFSQEQQTRPLGHALSRSKLTQRDILSRGEDPDLKKLDCRASRTVLEFGFPVSIMNAQWLRRPTSRTAVIFLHGFRSSTLGSWQNSSRISWPQLLENESQFKDLGIYTFDYYTDLQSGSYRLGDAVDALKENLRMDGAYKANRLIFVCHSMGGIVVRKFIVDRQLDILSAKIAIGLFLVASPSLGSSYANFFSKLVRFLHNSQLDILRFSQDNAWLNDLDTTFRNLIHREVNGPNDPYARTLHGRELVEDKPIFLKGLIRNQVVPPFSGATYFGEAFKIAQSDHFSIAKPENAVAQQHRVLCQFIDDELSRSSSTPASETPASLCQVKLLKDPSDPDLILALHLYEDRIPEDERFESSDIIRWIREDVENREPTRSPAAPLDYFLIEKCGEKVLGCALLHYYPETGFAFFAYLVTDRGVNADQHYISHKIITDLATLFSEDEWLRGCRSVLLEVDNPRAAVADE